MTIFSEFDGLGETLLPLSQSDKISKLGIVKTGGFDANNFRDVVSGDNFDRDNLLDILFINELECFSGLVWEEQFFELNSEFSLDGSCDCGKLEDNDCVTSLYFIGVVDDDVDRQDDGIVNQKQASSLLAEHSN